MKSSSHDSISSVFAYHSIILLLVHDIILERISSSEEAKLIFRWQIYAFFLDTQWERELKYIKIR